jgi:hypothetical protein
MFDQGLWGWSRKKDIHRGAGEFSLGYPVLTSMSASSVTEGCSSTCSCKLFTERLGGTGLDWLYSRGFGRGVRTGLQGDVGVCILERRDHGTVQKPTLA